MSETQWIKVWLQGGAVHDWHYFTLIEPPEVIHVIPSPSPNGSDWVHVTDPWEGESVAYRREPSVEQFAFERIYYPAGDLTV